MPSYILWITMNNAIITTKVDLQTKRLAQKTAADLGMPLSVVIKAFLKHFVRTKAVSFSLEDEVPNAYLRRLMREVKKHLKEGKASPAFDNAKDAISYLEKQGI